MFVDRVEQQVAEIEASMAEVAAGLDPDDTPASSAPRLYQRLDRIARCAAAAKTNMARRVEDSQVWKRHGYRSAAEYLAATSGTSVGAARGELDTSRSLPSLPATRKAMNEGTLSPDQGSVIAGAAKVNPGAETTLIEQAGRVNLKELRDDAQRTKAAADPDPSVTHQRIHRQRHVRRYTDAEGARNLHIRGTVDQLSVVEAELDLRTDRIFRARSTTDPDQRETREAYVVDALVEMSRRSARADDAPGDAGRARQPRPEHLALLRIDVEALRRGQTEGDELCEITGLGPIPVPVARCLLGDAVLKLVITKGEDVAHVTSLTRGPTQAMRYAQLWTSPTCTVDGCSRTIVEYDHAFGAEYATTRHTRLAELDPVCPGHHDLHTYQGWALVPGTGKRPMVPPDDPRHPANKGDPRAGPEPSASSGSGAHDPHLELFSRQPA